MPFPQMLREVVDVPDGAETSRGAKAATPVDSLQ